jgi:hypothetical protein
MFCDDVRACYHVLLLQVAGSARGVSAFQMDIKVEGITLDIMRQVRQEWLVCRQSCCTCLEGDIVCMIVSAGFRVLSFSGCA